MESVVILVGLSTTKFFIEAKTVTHAVLRACYSYENRNIFQLFLTSVKKNCIIIFFCETR
ncbi:hypothetical protein [Helicobacter pylori]|uniref:hypothetical protein n=1 Tax=Helicobacter pylori TaxID=210 RepID=UPI001F0959E8|nr:hypothetical protein [Helicobacter pylori]